MEGIGQMRKALLPNSLKLVLASALPTQTSLHRQVVNRKLGPVDFCPPFITLLIVKVISLLQQWAYRPIITVRGCDS